MPTQISAPAPLRLAVFDLDGTLIDSANTIVESVQACWDACGFPEVSPDQIRRIIGLPWEESIKALMPDAGEPEILKVRGYYDEVNRGVRPRPVRQEALFEGIADVLNELEAKGYLLAVVTSRNSRLLGKMLDRLGLDGRFVSLRTPDHGPGKPNPHLLLETMDLAGVRPEETAMIGDTTWDVMMAVNAKTSGIGVTWGVHEADELHEAGAHHVADAVADLPGAVYRLTGHDGGI
jgi:phosphoglycolate phosphatase